MLHKIGRFHLPTGGALNGIPEAQDGAHELHVACEAPDEESQDELSDSDIVYEPPGVQDDEEMVGLERVLAGPRAEQVEGAIRKF